MANPLLDFVMSVVRDPDVAAHYAADPAGAIAAANLTGVTTADVAQLIPAVSESVPSVDANVWTSGAATAAFDAFDAFGAQVPTVSSVITQLPDTGIHQVISEPAAFDEADLPAHAQLPDLVAPDDVDLHSDIPVVDTALDWHHGVDTGIDAADHPGVDFFS